MLKTVQLNNNYYYLINNILQIEYKSFNRPWTKENILYEINSETSYSFALLLNNKLIGYLFSTKLFDELQINKFCINSEMRNKGYGYYLLDIFIKKSVIKKYKKIYLEVNENNLNAIKLYKKVGFKINRIREKIYDDKYNAIEMILTII